MWFPMLVLFLVIASHTTACHSPLPQHKNDLEELLLSRMNFSVDPCDNFYNYACGNSDNYFVTMKNKIQRDLKNALDKLISSGHYYPKTSAYGKALRLYEACVNENVTKAEVDAHTKENVNKFLEKFNFPIDFFFDDNAEVKIDRERLSEILKYVHDNFFIEPFFEIKNIRSKAYGIENPKNFGLLAFYEVNKTFDHIAYECNSPKLLDMFIDSVQNVNAAMGLAATDCKIEKTARKLMEFELRLRKTPCGNTNITITTPSEEKLVDVGSLTFEKYGIDLNNYVRSLIETGIGPREVDIGLAIDSLREFLESASDTDLLRYIYFRIVDKNAVNIDCVDTSTLLKLVKSRIYTEAKYSSPEEREYFSDGIKFADVIDIVKENLRNMVLSMPFIQQNFNAYHRFLKKFDNQRAEVAIENYLLNDTFLNEYYEQLLINDDDSFLDMYSKAQHFVMYGKIRSIIRDQTDFEEDLTILNAMFYPNLNKFVIYDGWLNAPIYDKKYDFSFNFGSIAGVAGHEMGHSVDATNINFDENGFRSPLALTNASFFEFFKMISCVINEYSKIPVLPDNYTVNHVNGQQTLGENMADISGFEAAYRAFEIMKQAGKLSTKPSFNHPNLRGLTQDQVFFLGVANTFCSKQDDDLIYFMVTSDPHTPNPARDFSLTSVPAFGRAFNCPVGSVYRPTEYCKVWIY